MSVSPLPSVIHIRNLNTWKKVKREGYESLVGFLQWEGSTTGVELCDRRWLYPGVWLSAVWYIRVGILEQPATSKIREAGCPKLSAQVYQTLRRYTA